MTENKMPERIFISNLSERYWSTDWYSGSELLKKEPNRVYIRADLVPASAVTDVKRCSGCGCREDKLLPHTAIACCPESTVVHKRFVTDEAKKETRDWVKRIERSTTKRNTITTRHRRIFETIRALLHEGV